MAELASLLWITAELGCLFLFCACFLERKKVSIVSVLLTTVTICWILWYSNYYTGKIPSAFFTPVTYLAVSFLFYRGQWTYRVIAVLMSVLLIVIMDAIIIYIWSSLLRISTVEFSQRVYSVLSAGTISKFTAILIAWQLYRFFSTKKTDNIKTKWIVLTLLFPAISYVLLVIMFTSFSYDRDISAKALGITFAVAIANVSTIYIIFQIEKSEEKAQRAALLDQQMDIQTQSILSLEKSYRSQRAASHDYLHHLNAINALLEKGQYNAATQYIHELRVQHTTRVFAVNSHHPVVDAILNQKYQVAKEHDIDMQIQVNNLSELDIPTEKVVVLLSNLLDNAIEACERYSGDRVIQISLILKDTLSLSIRNTSNPVTIANGIPITTKHDKQNHGYGLLNITRILDSLGAEHAWRYQDNWFTFAAEIPTI